MKMCTVEKSQGLRKMILFVEIFANVKRLGFDTFVRACRLSKSSSEYLVLFFLSRYIFNNKNKRNSDKEIND